LTPCVEHHCSKLIFAVKVGSDGTPQLDQLRRVREPVIRSKAGIQGRVADVVFGRSRHAESQNELKAFQIVMATARADSWQEQPFTLEYRHAGTRHRYTPDALLAWGTHQTVVEIKEDKEAESIETQAKFRAIEDRLAEHGYHFRLWRSSEIRAEPRLANANLTLRYRCVAVPRAERERVRRAFASAPEIELRSLCEITKVPARSVLRLLIDGAVHIDWWKPLCLSSTVSIAPIGRQEWPSPPAVERSIAEEIRCR
jgi:TnsA endonuclease N terminal